MEVTNPSRKPRHQPAPRPAAAAVPSAQATRGATATSRKKTARQAVRGPYAGCCRKQPREVMGIVLSCACKVLHACVFFLHYDTIGSHGSTSHQSLRMTEERKVELKHFCKKLAMFSATSQSCAWCSGGGDSGTGMSQPGMTSQDDDDQ